MNFAELGLRRELVRAVTDAGYNTPTSIQERGIPVALEGRDLIACAQTGTGKTAAFLLPILQRLAGGQASRHPRALVIAPTRELAAQIEEMARQYGKRKWYVASGYSRRSKVETTFHRYKAILGSAMRARGLASQRVEVRLGCKILNTMTALGIPDGEMIG